MSLESLAGRPPELKPQYRGSTVGFDLDRRMEIEENKAFFQRSNEKFDPDKRMEVQQTTDTRGVQNDSTEKRSSHEEVIDGVTYYYDDNGILYRVGNELTPGCTYELNGYRYQTDDMGRIRSAEGTLHQKEHEGRLTIKDSIEDIGKGDQREGDDRGHLIGDQFDGSNGLENMIPQDAEINRTDFRNFENELAKAVKDGRTVDYEVEPVYDGESRRPSAIVVTYHIDGETSVRVFPNGKEN